MAVLGSEAFLLAASIIRGWRLKLMPAGVGVVEGFDFGAGGGRERSWKGSSSVACEIRSFGTLGLTLEGCKACCSLGSRPDSGRDRRCSSPILPPPSAGWQWTGK